MRAACLPRGQGADRRPIQIGAAVGEQRQETVAQQAGDRQRHLELFTGGKHQSDVLEAEVCGEASGLELVTGDQSAVRLVHRRTEQRRGQDLQIVDCLSTPALPTNAIASPSDSITEAIRKLPLSFTRLATFGSSDTTNVRWPIASNTG